MAVSSLLDRAIYSFADVDRLIGLSPGTARRWIDGYRDRSRTYPPVLRAEPTGGDAVTWGELVEARLLAEFRGQRVPLQRLRPTVNRLRDEFGPYPLAHARPLLDVEGREVVLRVQQEEHLEPELQLVVVRNEQLMLDVRAQRFSDAADYDDNGVVTSLRPEGRTPLVVVDPARSFGQPSIGGVRTDVLAEEYRAGETRESIADLYELSPEQVDQALRFELIAASHTG